MLYICFIYVTLSTPSSTASLPAVAVAPPARELEWWNFPLIFLSYHGKLELYLFGIKAAAWYNAP